MIVIILFISFYCLKCSASDLPIGGLFYDNKHEEAFELATEILNEDNPELPFQLVSVITPINSYNTLKAYVSTCSLLNIGVVGIFGPSSLHSSPYIQSVCDMKEIPHIETHYDPTIARSNCLVNLYPHPEVLSQAYVQLVKSLGWKNFTILYQNDKSLTRINELINLNAVDGHVVSLKQLELELDPGLNPKVKQTIDPTMGSGSYRPVLNKAKKTGVTNFFIECSIDILQEVLKQAQQVGLMTERFNYIIANLDMQIIDLSHYQYGGTTILGFRLIDPMDDQVVKISEKLHQKRTDLGKLIDFPIEIAAWKLDIATALTFDAVSLFFRAIEELTTTKKLNIVPKQIECNGSENWEHGYTIINYMKRTSIEGLTGTVKFDNQGFRTNFNLGIVELSPGGLINIGTWNSSIGLNFTKRPEEKVLVNPKEGPLSNKTFVVIISLNDPYGMLKKTSTQLHGNDRFEGFGIDIIEDLSRMLGFNYTFIVQEDGSNGNYDQKSKKWTGMIGAVVDGRADLAITDLTVTSDRENAVDFTMPFMNLGITILYRKPEPVPPSLFLFASPFSLSVWVMLGISYLLISIAFFIMGRLSPSEWTNPYPCVEDPEYLINQFSMKNCLWFTVGSLMQQGSEIAPIGISTRMAAGVWWFFILIIVASYTANLTAFLTVTTLVTSFKNIEELAAQNEIKYGSKKNGATANFFRESNISTYAKVWHYMVKHPEDMTLDNDEGVRRVETENYAYIMESSSIEYVIERHCTLAKIGNKLDDKGYGIAMKKESPYRNELSTAVLKLQETGRLTDLKIKWWKEKRGGGSCAGNNEGGEATPLDLQNVGGVFLVLFIGTIFGVIGSFLELLYYIFKKRKKLNMPFKELIKKEFNFFIRFKQNVKTVETDDDDDDEDDDNEDNLLDSMK